MLSRPGKWFGLICWIFLNSYCLKGDEADLFKRFEHQANEEVLSREQELQTFKPKFTQQEVVKESIPIVEKSPHQDVFVRFEKIDLVGANLLSKQAKAKLVKPYLNKAITLQQLDELVLEILQWYFDRGFNTTRAGFNEESFAEKGVLKIYVVEGKVGRVLIEENGKPRKRFNTVAPFKSDALFCLRDYEQAIDMIQRLPSLNAQLDIVPLEEDGKSDVVIKVDKQKPISFLAGYDNEGSPTYGQRSYNMGVTFDDLAGLYDMLHISYHTNERLYKGRYSKTFSALYSVPCGNHLWSVAHSDSRFLTTTQGQVQPIKFEGGTQSLGLDWDYVLQRSRTSKTQIGLELNHKRIRNEIQGMRQITGCRNLTTLQVKLSHMVQVFRGWMTATVRFIRGLRCNSLGSATTIPTTFHKFAGDISLIEPLGNTSFQWRLQASGQYSKDRLYGSETLSIGGNSTVRGFEESLYSGECGGYIRNELCYRFNPCKLGSNELFVGYDVGRIFRNHTTQNVGTLSGFSCGWRFSRDHFNAEVALSKALQPRSKGMLFNFKLGVNF